jgi:hypothetical protein
VFENRVPRKLFGIKRDAVTVEWRRLNNEELNDLYNSLIVNRVITSRRMRRAGSRGKYGRQERCIKDFGWNTLGKETTWKKEA